MKIIANVYRTNPKSIERLGRVAFQDMRFNDTTEADVRSYCEQLARDAGVQNPHIVTTEA